MVSPPLAFSTANSKVAYSCSPDFGFASFRESRYGQQGQCHNQGQKHCRKFFVPHVLHKNSSLTYCFGGIPAQYSFLRKEQPVIFKGFPPEVFLQRFSSRGFPQRFSSRGFPPEVFLQRFSSRGFPPEVFLQRFSSRGFPPEVFPQRFSSRGFPPEVFLQRFSSRGFPPEVFPPEVAFIKF